MSKKVRKRKRSTVRHNRAIQLDRSKRPSAAPPHQAVQDRLTELIRPATYTLSYAMNLADSIVRMRYRNSYEKPELMTPGEVYQVVIEPQPTSNLFRAGHRIRLDVSSSNFPQFDVNPNTGGPLGIERRVLIAHDTVYHDARHASHIELPIVHRPSSDRDGGQMR